jgi:membrane protease YdiL (CAAX protease family)
MPILIQTGREANMENQPLWKAKSAILCYIALAAGIVLGSLIVAAILLGLGLDSLNLQEMSFPLALISLPITEGIILTITLLFARYKGASLRDLGLKKPRLKIMVIVSLAAVLLLILAGSIGAVEETVLGPEPDAANLTYAVLPRNGLQLIALLAISIALVGPAEELAFRGFVQRGFENSFGKVGSLLIASILFGLLHGLNSFYSILPVTIVSLFLGYVWQKTDGNTTATAWLHGLYDAIAIAISYFAFA